MAADRRLRKFIRQWRKRYPFPSPWVDDRANRQCRRSEALWLARFDGASTLRRRDVEALVRWRFALDSAATDEALRGVTGPAQWGHARRCIKKALASSTPTGALDRLLDECGGIPGGPTMASAVLAACRPTTYAVADERALRTLRALKLYDPAEADAFARGDWWPYLRVCRKLAGDCGVTLREVDHALWAAADHAPMRPPPPEKPARSQPR